MRSGLFFLRLGDGLNPVRIWTLGISTSVTHNDLSVCLHAQRLGIKKIARMQSGSGPIYPSDPFANCSAS